MNKNWKTSVAGCLPLIITTLEPLTVHGAVWDYKAIGMSVGIAILGFLAKDWNTAGLPPTQKNTD